jgi:UDP-N-acetylglucosamine--N-acetylmuramyl-(pentapeptide) pyrophosphoryl-undecaprenol N-acetylglucosamine transferase
LAHTSLVEARHGVPCGAPAKDWHELRSSARRSKVDAQAENVNSSATFLIAAGGTGGHVIPGLQIARELRRRGHNCLFVGTARGLESRLVPREGFALELLPAGALNRVSIRRQLVTMLRLPQALFEAGQLIDRERPAAVLSLGGYAAGPVLVASIMREIPVVVVEPNAKPGLAHRLAGPLVARALLGFPRGGRYFREGRSEFSGIPVREEFFGIPPKPHGRPCTVLITGGSQGSQRLNRAALEAVALWAAKNRLGELKFLHQTGANEYNEIQSAYVLHRANAEVAPFFDDMPRAFAEADLVICRSGASAVGELAAAGKASILIPFPFSADDHQARNAEAMAAAGGARLVLDSDWNGKRMVEEIERLLDSPALLEQMEKAARTLARPGAAARAAGRLEELARFR